VPKGAVVALVLAALTLLSVSGKATVWAAQNQLVTWDEAMADYNGRIASDPHGAPWAYFQRGNLWFVKQEWARAVDDYSAVLQQLPEDQNVYHNRGLAWAQLKQYQWALADLTQAVRLEPKGGWLYSARGYVWAEMGSFENAIADYSAALDLSPNEPKALVGRGLASVRAGRPDAAIADLTGALRLNPGLARAYLARGLAWKAKQDYRLALDDFAWAIRLAPGDADAYSAAAIVWAACPDPNFRDGRRAFAAAFRACQLHNNACAACFDALAAAYAEAGDFALAVKWQTKAIEALAMGSVEEEPMADRLALYQNKLPYREPAPEPTPAIAATPAEGDPSAR
jgi:tetratricopeptide (TPR) repeat protein